MFDFPKKLAFGLDLSDRSLKIVQFKKWKNQLFLSSFIKKDIPDGIVCGGIIQNEKELIGILKKALKEIKGDSLTGKRVTCNLPEEKVFIRVIQLPLMKEEEIAQAIQWEAEAHIPISANEAYIDWQVIKPTINHLDHLDVLIAATPRDLANSYLNFLKNGGLQPIALEPESVAVVRSLIKQGDCKPTIIIDLGTTGTNFVIFSDRAIRFTSHIHISGQFLEHIIAEDLKISEKEAHQLKIEVGLDETKGKGEVSRVLQPLIDKLVKQINEYIDFYYDNMNYVHVPEEKIEQVLLCGGDSLLINLPSYLEQKLKIPVKVGEPLKNISTAGVKDKVNSNEKTIFPKKESLAYSTAIGLALNEND